MQSSNQMQNSIYAYNGNFIDCTTTAKSASTTNDQMNRRYDCEININDHHQNVQLGHTEKHQSMSTYDYLYSQWKEAIGNLSWEADTDAETTIDNSSEITLTSTIDESNVLCTNETSYFDVWFHKLWKMHTSYETRYYHTAVHLEEMCFYLQLVFATTSSTNHQSDAHSNVAVSVENRSEGKADGCTALEVGRTQLSIKSLLLLSIFFHDAIYDAHSSTNEEDSAKLFESKFAKNTNLHPSNVQLVVSYILATKHHTISESSSEGKSIVDCSNTVSQDPLHLFLDMDMSVLGKVSEAYQQYAILIRKEYSFVPADIYCSKRADILEHFLIQSKRIYHTSLFYDAFELRARHNVQKEIELLRQGIIPT